ncbi:D-alanyl-D-alanine carboxypeptidase/D-alanyl-D-alanine-endopeptidase [soil metagenome]
MPSIDLLRRTVIPFAAALSTGACAAATSLPTPAPVPLAAAITTSIDSIVDAPPVDRASWGVMLQDAGTGAVLYSRNPHRLFIPASNMKLVVTAVALGRLGPDWRYRTEVLAHPVTAGATAAVIVLGVGDPTWSTRFHDSVSAPFDSLAAVVQRSGIRQADRLVIDVSRFRDEPIHPTWEVSDLPGVFAPPVDAFAAADGTFRLALSGGPAVGAPGTASVVPPLWQPLSATVTTDTAGARPSVAIDFRARRDTVHLVARAGLGASDTTTHAVTRPAEAAAAALVMAMQVRGISIGSVAIVRDSVEAAALRQSGMSLGALESAPLADIVTTILRPSQNWISEQLLKTLGAEFGGEGSWSAGHAVQREYLVNVVGVDSTAFQLRDASGMSAQNLLTPSTTLSLLAHSRAQPWAGTYRVALAQPGLTGSTLSGRLRTLEGRVHAKTGTITNVNSLSGYFTAADGREYLFVVLTNGSGIAAAVMRGAIDEVVLAMARHLDTPH